MPLRDRQDWQLVTAPTRCPTPAPAQPRLTEDEANRAFSISVVASGIRCLLTYIVFPWVLPAVGIARGVGPGIGIAVGALAIAFNVASIRRFWLSDHHYKWPISVLNTAVIGLLVVLISLDIHELIT